MVTAQLGRSGTVTGVVIDDISGQRGLPPALLEHLVTRARTDPATHTYKLLNALPGNPDLTGEQIHQILSALSPRKRQIGAHHAVNRPTTDARTAARIVDLAGTNALRTALAVVPDPDGVLAAKAARYTGGTSSQHENLLMRVLASPRHRPTRPSRPHASWRTTPP